VTSPNGYRAGFDGAEFDASPDGDLVRLYSTEAVTGFELVGTGRYRRLVPAADLDWFGYLRSTATVDGHDAVVIEVRDGHALIEYDHPEHGTRREWVTEEDLTDRRERRWSAG
jgi:hypothetical protein